MKIEYNPIGIVYTPFKDLSDIPNQPSQAKGIVFDTLSKSTKSNWFLGSSSQQNCEKSAVYFDIDILDGTPVLISNHILKKLNLRDL